MGAGVKPNAARHVIAQHDGHAVADAPHGGVKRARGGEGLWRQRP